MKKSDINPMPDYFDRYINLVADVELSQAFDDSIEQLNDLDKNLLEAIGNKKPVPDKWMPKEIIQHIIDFERILSFRALLFARREGSIPQSVDQDRLAENMRAEKRSIDSLITELKAVRASSKAMFDNFDEEMLLAKGINWKYEISVLAMGFALLGHQIHHLKIIEENYYPLPVNDLSLSDKRM
ncbi:MAG TPA: DinB family protein [Pyrinomonadaceae bacterium]|nr:DinB family protein [Pyrinomonadaceae bacterium]